MLQRELFSESIALYRLTAEAFPDLAAVHAALGDAYLAASDTTRAITRYERAVELDPQHLGATAKLRELRGRGR